MQFRGANWHAPYVYASVKLGEIMLSTICRKFAAIMSQNMQISCFLSSNRHQIVVMRRPTPLTGLGRVLMRRFQKGFLAALLCATALTAQPALAQDDSAEVDALKAEVAALKAQIAALSAKVDAIGTAPAPAPASVAAAAEKKSSPEISFKGAPEFKAGVSSRADACIMTPAMSASRGH
jgi:cell division protein FtsB